VSRSRDRARLTPDRVGLAGSLSPRALALVGAWAALHRDELLEDWEQARQMVPLLPIAPLD